MTPMEIMRLQALAASAAAKENVGNAFDDMRFLMNVTGFAAITQSVDFGRRRRSMYASGDVRVSGVFVPPIGLVRSI